MCGKKNGVAYVVILGLVSVGGLSLLFGCEQAPPPPPPTKIEKTEPPPPKASEQDETEAAVTEEPNAPEYEYDASGRREPFASLVKGENPDPKEVMMPPDLTVLKTPLQKFDVNTLQLKGILLGSLGDYARVEAPDGKSYTIDVGTLVGMHEGEVISISDNSVVVREVIRYESGKVEDLETPLYLNPVEEEVN